MGVLAQGGMMEKRDPVTDRQELMKNTGANFKDLQNKAKAGQFAAIAVNAQNIAINSRHVPMLFPKDSMGTPEQKSRAKPEIWQDWDTFVDASEKVQQAATDLMNLTKDAEKTGVTAEQVEQSWKALGNACKNCHDKFRVPEKKS
jgi:cytochrome c556